MKVHKMYKLAILLIACYMSTASALPPCVCARDFTPVCGSDGQTYPNNCMLECAALTKPDLKLARGGSCEQDLSLPQSNEQACICTFEFKPVCGIDGTTYPNQCALGCEKSRNPTIEKLHDGRCKSEEASDSIKVAKLPTCTCTRNLQPVCGTDGVTYNNICLLKCAAQNKPLAKKDDGPCGDTTVQVVEEPEKQLPKENCVCFRNYKPVCGSDGKTYANSCVLGCASNDKSGLTEVHRGRC